MPNGIKAACCIRRLSNSLVPGRHILTGVITAIRRCLLAALLLTTSIYFVVCLVNRIVQAQAARGIQGGFGFLLHPAGFRISEGLLQVAPSDPYFLAIVSGLVNTLTVAALSLGATTVLGIAVGLLRLSTNPVVDRVSNAIVEPIRNTPVLLQLFVWYGLLLQLPQANDAWVPFGGAILSNRGLSLPAIHGLGPIVVAFAIATGLSSKLKSFAARALALGALALLTWLVAGPISIETPVREGLGLKGGWQLSIEFSALCLGLSLFHAAYISDIVRGSIRAVPLGLVEAGRALALSPWHVMRFVIFPYALRIGFPAYANQCLSLVKNSSLAIVIGYQDLMAIINTAITQTGLALEGVTLAVGIYLSIAALFSCIAFGVHAHTTRYGIQTIATVSFGSSLRSPRFSMTQTFGTIGRLLLSVITATAILLATAKLIDWSLIQAVWHGGSTACTNAKGACWSAVTYNLQLLLFGTMDSAHYHRAIAASASIAFAAVCLLVSSWPASLRVGLFLAGGLLCAGILTGYPMGWIPITPIQWGGLLVTFVLAIAAILLAIPGSIALALMRVSSQRWLSIPASALIEAIRGVPLITQLLFVYFILPLLVGTHEVVPKFAMALIALSLHTACVLAEVLRGALLAVPPGQTMSAKALGMKPHTVFVEIVLPQAQKIAIPAALGVFVGAIKDTSLVTVIGIFDVLSAAKAVVAQTEWRPYYVEIYVFVALIYFLVCFALSRFAKRLERQKNHPVPMPNES